MAGNGHQSGWGGDQAGRTLPEGFTVPDGAYGAAQGGYGHRPDGYGAGGYGTDGYGPGGYGAGDRSSEYQSPEYQSSEYPSSEYPEYLDQQGGPEGGDNVTTYRAGGRTTPRAAGRRLDWRELLVGIYRAPARTFDQMRDHQVWLPAVCVSLVYGVLAVFGFGDTRSEVVKSTFTVALWSLAGAAVAFTVAGLILGTVTYALARQFGGDGPLAPTVGLAVLVGWTSDAPRLLAALVLPSSGPVVQLLAWASWLLCAVLLTVLVRRVHDLPWGKAAGAVLVQLLALLVMVKLPTLG
ncbi:Yip1 family protein [Kitasatospora viridis]|uniref:Yip1-like protein n=1 Tax=Kitasatospora viridis TaxID=281105 RepID=A0A561UHT1_9ACTN|nr:Yip1 family protein [Kitasatospora viridis]TWF98913.1 Yip1-like protein [Kitasatospora viridis]